MQGSHQVWKVDGTGVNMYLNTCHGRRRWRNPELFRVCLMSRAGPQPDHCWSGRKLRVSLSNLSHKFDSVVWCLVTLLKKSGLVSFIWFFTFSLYIPKVLIHDGWKVEEVWGDLLEERKSSIESGRESNKVNVLPAWEGKQGNVWHVSKAWWKQQNLEENRRTGLLRQSESWGRKVKGFFIGYSMHLHLCKAFIGYNVHL